MIRIGQSPKLKIESLPSMGQKNRKMSYFLLYCKYNLKTKNHNYEINTLWKTRE